MVFTFHFRRTLPPCCKNGIYIYNIILAYDINCALTYITWLLFKGLIWETCNFRYQCWAAYNGLHEDPTNIMYSLFLSNIVIIATKRGLDYAKKIKWVEGGIHRPPDSDKIWMLWCACFLEYCTCYITYKLYYR